MINEEVSHKRPQIILLHSYEMSRVGESIKTESKSVVAKGWGKEEVGERGYSSSMVPVSFLRS